MTCKPAPACLEALEEASRRWPHRFTASDGLCGDAAHQARVSDHNPDASGYEHAFDLTHDLVHGVDTYKLAHQLASRRDPRIKYIISFRQIWNPQRGWHPYTGIDPHYNHMHVSILSGSTFDTRSWWHGGRIKHILSHIKRVLTGHRQAPPWPGRYIRLTSPLSHGSDISTWQKQMKRRKWRIKVDGIYGPKSHNICLQFQQQKGLEQDGVIGPKTWRAAWTAPRTKE